MSCTGPLLRVSLDAAVHTARRTGSSSSVSPTCRETRGKGLGRALPVRPVRPVRPGPRGVMTPTPSPQTRLRPGNRPLLRSTTSARTTSTLPGRMTSPPGRSEVSAARPDVVTRAHPPRCSVHPGHVSAAMYRRRRPRRAPLTLQVDLDSGSFEAYRGRGTEWLQKGAGRRDDPPEPSLRPCLASTSRVLREGVREGG